MKSSGHNIDLSPNHQSANVKGNYELVMTSNFPLSILRRCA